METNEDGKIAEQIFRQNSHKTTKQTLEFLESNEYFQKDISDLRIKWASVIGEFNSCYKKATQLAEEKAFSKVKLPEKIAWKDIWHWVWELIKAKLSLPKKEQKELAEAEKKMLLTLANKDLTNDIIELCKKYKQLSPIGIWLPQIRTYLVMNYLFPPDFFLTAGLKGYFTKEEIINAPQDLNFIPRIETNPVTGENKLVVEFLDNTTLKQDFGKHWKIIDKIQKLLRREKGIKRFHPVKNQEIAEEVAELDKQKTETYFDPLSKQLIETKITDIAKALKVYDDVPFGKKDELKAGNRTMARLPGMTPTRLRASKGAL